MPIHVRPVESGLQRRVVPLLRGNSGASHVLVLIQGGECVLTDGTDEITIAGPAIVWRCAPAGTRLIFEAGAGGYLAEISEETISRAIGDFFESATLHFILDRDLALPFRSASDTIAQVRNALGAIVAELETPATGTSMMLVAHLRIVLVTIMRAVARADVAAMPIGEHGHFLQRFRQLVEANFRAHWTVSRYAAEIGVTSDRLHAICTRELGKSPKSLISERLAREASLALERSTLSIKQLTYALGFRDPAHFANFYRRMTGFAPGRYRRLLASSTPGTPGFEPPSFADWP